jgi:glycogen operon protein
MKCSHGFAAFAFLVLVIFNAVPRPAAAAINSMNLGATYDAQQANITFRVYSSTATRVMVYLYAGGYGKQDALRYVLSPVGSGVWAKTVPVSSLQASGITGGLLRLSRLGSELAIQLQLDERLDDRLRQRR